MAKFDRFQELPFDKPSAPEKTEYECDVLVIGGGYAGICAAVTARKAGRSVILVDKGRPGYSGQSPHACCTRWFDDEMGDDRDFVEDYYVKGGQYLANRNWIRAWFDDSKGVQNLYTELGLTEQYTNANVTGYAENNDYFGYRDFVGGKLRHKRVMPALKKQGVEVVDQTMIYDVVKKDDRIIGAVGFHTPSGAAMTFSAKATVMCMGGGVYKPAGWPSRGISFDAIAIGYKLGLPIIGEEFEDYHQSRGDMPSNAFVKEAFPYLQNLMFNGGEIKEANKEELERNAGAFAEVVLNGGLPFDSDNKGIYHKIWPNDNPEDLRFKREDIDEPKNSVGGAMGVAPGWCVHTASGIYCGDEDTHGYTGIPGLYCAGDGCNAGPVGGATYAGRAGFTSNFFGVQGKRSGEAAAAYVEDVDLVKIDQETVAAITEEFTAPLRLERGYDAMWALDCLQGVMVPFWVLLAKSEERLNAALVNICFMRDHVLPKVMAMDSHDLRYVAELKNKVLQAEMKLRLSLARKESRGNHFRTDYPYRNDEIGLCYYAAVQKEDGSMGVERIDYPDEWKGDLNAPYMQRYPARFPGEEEAIKELGWV